MGGDIRDVDSRPIAHVSIHAPAWGATQLFSNKTQKLCCFNPRPRMGGDWPSTSFALAEACFNPRPRMGGDTLKIFQVTPTPMFQSTPPHGGRRSTWLIMPFLMCFNPRPRMGGDFPARWLYDLRQVSIHAPAWGATAPTSPCALVAIVSIHAPAWGATGYL